MLPTCVSCVSTVTAIDVFASVFFDDARVGPDGFGCVFYMGDPSDASTVCGEVAEVVCDISVAGIESAGSACGGYFVVMDDGGAYTYGPPTILLN